MQRERHPRRVVELPTELGDDILRRQQRLQSISASGVISGVTPAPVPSRKRRARRRGTNYGAVAAATALGGGLVALGVYTRQMWRDAREYQERRLQRLEDSVNDTRMESLQVSGGHEPTKLNMEHMKDALTSIARMMWPLRNTVRMLFTDNAINKAWEKRKDKWGNNEDDKELGIIEEIVEDIVQPWTDESMAEVRFVHAHEFVNEVFSNDAIKRHVATLMEKATSGRGVYSRMVQFAGNMVSLDTWIAQTLKETMTVNVPFVRWILSDFFSDHTLKRGQNAVAGMTSVINHWGNVSAGLERAKVASAKRAENFQAPTSPPGPADATLKTDKETIDELRKVIEEHKAQIQRLERQLLATKPKTA